MTIKFTTLTWAGACGLVLCSLLAAGAQAQEASGLSVWTATSHSNVADHNKIVSLFNRGSVYEGEINSFSVGVDKRQNARLLTGVSLNAVNVNLDTPWNIGSFESDSLSLAPYFTYLLNDTFSLNGSLGYAWNHNNAKSDLNNPFSPNTASYNSGRVFGSLGIKASRWFDKLNLTGHLTYTHSSEHFDSYSWKRAGVPFMRVKSTTTDYDRFEAGVKASYLFGKAMPYLGIAYGDADSNRLYSLPTGFTGTKSDLNGFVYSLGVNLFVTNAVSAGIHFRSEDRHKIQNDSLSANLTVKF